MGEKLFLLVLAIGAGAFIYFKMFKKGGCGCGNGGCCDTKKDEEK